MNEKYIKGLRTATPIQRVEPYLVKRDDLFAFNGARGGKVRTCYKMIKTSEGAVTYASRTSPQMNYTALVCQGLGKPCRVHTAHGAYTEEMHAAEKAGAEIIQHKPGYLNNLCRYAQDDAEASGLRYIPLSMESNMAIHGTAYQVNNLPVQQVLDNGGRIVVVAGGGLSLAGILHGLDALDMRSPNIKTSARDIKLVGVMIGRDPTPNLNKYAPPDWEDRVTLVEADTPYHKPAKVNTLGDIRLDSYYEAKCLPYLRAGDLFWIVGIRPTEGGA